MLQVLVFGTSWKSKEENIQHIKAVHSKSLKRNESIWNIWIDYEYNNSVITEGWGKKKNNTNLVSKWCMDESKGSKCV